VECPHTVFGSKSSAVCALAVYFVHSTRPKIQGLLPRDSIVDLQFVAGWVREWLILGVCAVRCRQPSSDVAINFGEKVSCTECTGHGMSLSWTQLYKWKLYIP